MVRLHQIVAGIPAEGDSPVVLFDFDEWFTVGVGTDFSPPEVRSSNTWTQLADGETTGASTLGDRVLRLVLTQFRGNAEDQAEVLQTLGRLLDDWRGQWFLWQDEGTVHERFFRTKRAPMSIEDHHLLERPKRTLTLSIPAEATAYGRLVEGSATVNNDPTAVTNPLMLTLPAIKGDVSTPLRVRSEFAALFVNTALASLAMPAGGTPTEPVWLPASALTPVAGAGYAWSTVADAAEYGGSFRRYTYSSGTPGATPALTGAGLLADVPAGDYRMFLRVKGSTLAEFDLGFGFGITGNTSEVLGWDFSYVGVSTSQFIDLGPVRLPAGYPEQGSKFPDDTPGREVAMDMYITPTGILGTLDVIGILFVPVGLDTGRESHYAASTQVLTGYPVTMDFDGIAGRLVPISNTDVIGTLRSFLAGDFPAVVPGAENTLHFVRHFVSETEGAGASDPKTATIGVDWSYYPRYLYIRSATG